MESYSFCIIHRVTTKLLHMYLSMANLGIADSVEAYLLELIKTWCSSMFSSQNPHILKVRDHDGITSSCSGCATVNRMMWPSFACPCHRVCCTE